MIEAIGKGDFGEPNSKIEARCKPKADYGDPKVYVITDGKVMGWKIIKGETYLVPDDYDFKSSELFDKAKNKPVSGAKASDL